MLIFIWLVIAGGVAYATGSIAAGKGRDRVAWTLIGFFFGLIGLLIASCVADRRPLDQPDGITNWR